MKHSRGQPARTGGGIRIRAGIVLLVVLVVAFAAIDRAHAQGAMATLTGIVSDQSNAVIPGANVVLKHEGTNALRRTATNADGFFSIQAIPAGSYTLSVEASGFNIWQLTALVLHPGDRRTVTDIVLSVAAAGERIEVSATAASVVPVDTGEKSQLITSQQIRNLSVLGRSADELLKILPGTVFTDPDGNGNPAGMTVQFNRGIGNYNVAGTRNTQVANLSDGANVIDPGCNCGSAVTPNMDMVSEVKVQTANFAAENAAGPVVFQSVSLLSKTGRTDSEGR